MERDNERELQRKKRYTKRRQQVMRQWIAIGVCALLIMVVAGVVVVKRFGKKTEEVEASKAQTEVASTEDTEASTGDNEASDTEETDKKSETTEERIVRVKAEATAGGYPAELIEILEKNPETVDLVEDYPTKKDLAPASTISEGRTPEKSGLVPILYQYDERWGYAAYGTSTVAVSGCGPTCLSMVIVGLTGDEKVTPAVVAAYGTANGAVDENNNTMWSFMTSAGSNWGVATREINPEESTVAKELNDGHVIVCSVGAGDFTDTGHFIVLTSYDNGNVTVCDPYRKTNTEKVWSYESIKGQMKVLWCYSKQ